MPIIVHFRERLEWHHTVMYVGRGPCMPSGLTSQLKLGQDHADWSSLQLILDWFPRMQSAQGWVTCSRVWLTIFLVKTLEIKSAFLLLQHNFCLLHPALPLLASVWNLFCFFYNSFQAAENINKMNPRPILTSPHSPYFIHVLQNTSHEQELRKEQTMIAKQMPSCLKK